MARTSKGIPVPHCSSSILNEIVIFFTMMHMDCLFPYNLHLDNSTTPSLPLVMICVQGQWGYVCGRKLPNSPWTKENVGVACQQLGFIREGISRRKAKLYTCTLNSGIF